MQFQVYKQKVKHLLFEQQTNMAEQKAENTLKLNIAKNEMNSNELDLRKDKRDLKVSMKEQQLQHEQTIKNLQTVNDEASNQSTLNWSYEDVANINQNLET